MITRHYEKVIIGCGFAFIFINVGLASTAFSVHQPYLVAMEGVGDTGGSLILSVRTLATLVGMLFVDRYFELLDVRRGVLLASLCTAAGFFVYSMATSLPVFFVGAAALGLGYGLGGLVAFTLLANRWFSAGVGGAVGFASMGSGVASVVIPLVVVRIIEASSLSVAFVFEGTLALAVGFAVFALLRNYPQDLGLAPYAGKPGKSEGKKREVMRAPADGERRLFLVAAVFVGMYCVGGVAYLSVLATSSGFDVVSAATIVSVAGAALTVSKFATGELFDYLGVARASALVFGIGAVGFLLCCFVGVGSLPLMLLGSAMMGAGMALGSVGISVWSLQTSDEAARGRHIKNMQVCFALGGFVANVLPGILKDLLGTYVVSYAGMLVVLVAAAVIVLRFYRKHTV